MVTEPVGEPNYVQDSDTVILSNVASRVRFSFTRSGASLLVGPLSNLIDVGALSAIGVCWVVKVGPSEGYSE